MPVCFQNRTPSKKMSMIVTTEAVVLSKSDFSNTSKIVTLYTEKLGKIAAIVKGGRDKNSKIGRTVEVLNIISVVLYNKDSREVQLLTSADMVSHLPEIHEDYSTLIYCQATIELFYHLIKEHEENPRLFNGLKKILLRFNQRNENPGTIFLRFLVFFIEIIGYEISTGLCQNCGNQIQESEQVWFNSINGIVCRNCSEKLISSKIISEELFSAVKCLKNGAKVSLTQKDEFQLLMLFESFLKYHVPDFPGFRSLKNLT